MEKQPKKSRKKLAQSLYECGIITIHIEKNFATLLLSNITSAKQAVDLRFKQNTPVSGDTYMDIPLQYFETVLTESLSNLEHYETQKQNETSQK